MTVGTYHVNATISECVEIAMKIAEQRNETLFILVGGHLNKIYERPIFLSPPPNFTRTFVRLQDEAFVFEDEKTETSIIAIKDYKKR